MCIRDRVKRVYLPAVMPELITGAQLAFGNAWRALISAEMLIGFGKGLGRSLAYLSLIHICGESASLAKAHADLGRRFGAGGEWGLRVNASRRDGGTPLAGVSRKDDVGTLALDYRGERLRAALDLSLIHI